MTETLLDTYIRVNDLTQMEGLSSEAIERKRYRADYPAEEFPADAYDELCAYSHFIDNVNTKEVARQHASNFEALMGFSIHDLEKRRKELETEANLPK